MAIITLNEYQTKARATAIYPNLGKNLRYTLMGLSGEAGELAGAVRNAYGTRVMRDRYATAVAQGMVKPEAENELARLKEAGDVAWYAANTAAELGLTFAEAMGPLMTANNIAAAIDDIDAALTICEAAGKALEVQKKIDRDAPGTEPFDTKRVIIIDSLQVIMTNLDMAAGHHLDEILAANLAKLESRKERGKLSGSGDDR